ncbi:MAG TPA: periplasmic heavy metal sensor [Thermoanaerobaculia bacterium]|nr:periplasmic heavy metal sensor [Thermoanaerobaculia bacterium]
MKKRNAVIALVLAATLAAAVPFVYAAPGRGGERHHGGPGPGILFGHLQHLQDELELSDAQLDQIRGIFSALHEQNAPYREQMQGGFKDVTTALLANPNDLTAAQALLDQQSSAERAAKANLLAATSKALNVLTVSQRAELAEIIKERQERRSGRRGNRR